MIFIFLVTARSWNVFKYCVARGCRRNTRTATPLDWGTISESCSRCTCCHCTGTRSQANKQSRHTDCWSVLNGDRAVASNRSSSNITDTNAGHILSGGKLITEICRSGCCGTRQCTTSQSYSATCCEGVSYRKFRRSSQSQPLGHTSTDCVVLVRGQSHSSQDTNNRHHDHQFDQGKTFLQGTLHKSLLGVNCK